MAVRGHDTVFAVVGIGLVGKPELEAYEKNLLLALLGECALALEKEALRERAEPHCAAGPAGAAAGEPAARHLPRPAHPAHQHLRATQGYSSRVARSSSVLDKRKQRAVYRYLRRLRMWLINLVENLLSVTRHRKRRHEHPHGARAVGARSCREALQPSEPARPSEHSVRFVEKDELLMAQYGRPSDRPGRYQHRGQRLQIYAHGFGHPHHRCAGRGTRVRSSDCRRRPGHFDDEAKLHLFDMFYTAGNQRSDGRRGLGLGLALCKSIVAAHGERD